MNRLEILKRDVTEIRRNKTNPEHLGDAMKLEQALHDYYGYSTTDIKLETGVEDYSWTLALDDLNDMGVDTSKLNPSTFFGYDLINDKEITTQEYANRLRIILAQELSLTMRDGDLDLLEIILTTLNVIV